jgi:predicted HTH domain antitoxin
LRRAFGPSTSSREAVRFAMGSAAGVVRIVQTDGDVRVAAEGRLDMQDRRGYLSSMTIVAITVPDDLPAALHVSTEHLASELAMAAATRLYEEHRVSLAKAAELAGMERWSFASRLSALGIATATFDLADVDAAREAIR